MAILTMLILPIHEHSIFLHLFVDSFIFFIFLTQFLWLGRPTYVKYKGQKWAFLSYS